MVQQPRRPPSVLTSPLKLQILQKFKYSYQHHICSFQNVKRGGERKISKIMEEIAFNPNIHTKFVVIFINCYHIKFYIAGCSE
jgi:hypothetical protein